MASASSKLKIATVILAAGLMSGCMSIVDPYVAPSANSFRSTKSIENAVTYAEDTREAYYRAISEHTMLNRASSLGIVGLAGSAAGLAITGGGGNLITGLGIGGASLFAANTVLYKEARLRAYNEGAKAVTCTLGVFGPLRAASQTTLQTQLNTLGAAVSALDAAIAAASSEPNSVEKRTLLSRGRQVSTSASDTLTRGRSALGRLSGAGVRLYDAVQSIRSIVYSALLKSEPDIAELVQTLGKTIPANAGLLTGLPIGQQMPQDQTRKFNLKKNPVLERLQSAIFAATNAGLDVESNLAKIGAAPSESDIAACEIDTAATGLLFETDPPNTVVIDTSTDKPVAKIEIKGGKGPYHADWVGQDPGKLVTLTAPSHTGGGRAVLKLESTKNANGAFQLKIRDENTPATAKLQVVLDPTGAKSAEPTKPPQVTAKEKAEITRVQAELIRLKCLPAKRADGKKNDDGIWKERSAEALQKLLALNKTTKAQFALIAGSKTSGEKFIKAVDAEIKSAKDNGKECSS